MSKIASSLVGLYLAVNLCGCSSSEALTKEQEGLVQQYVSKTPSAPSHKLDIQFGDAIALVGYDLSSETATPGEPLKVTWHFQVKKAVGDNWKLFTHLADGRDRSRVNMDGKGPLRDVFQPSKWQAGTYVRDEQTIELPKDWDSDKLVVYLGFWKDSERMPVKGPSDKQRRARALELRVNAQAKPEEVPELHAVQVKPKDEKTPAIKLDGKLDEPAWAEAKPTAFFVNTMTGSPADLKVTAKALWDAENVYVAFDVADDYLKSTFEKDDDHLWEQDCVELMFNPDGDGKNYFELQVSPAGKSFDTRYDTRRQPKPFGHMDFNSGIKNGVDVRGKLNDEDADQGYTAEVAIPWSAFAMGEPKHEAPKANDTWRMNLYVMDARQKGMRAAGWSAPLVGDFHVPARFGKITFDGAPAAEPAPMESRAKEAEKPVKSAAAAKKPATP